METIATSRGSSDLAGERLPSPRRRTATPRRARLPRRRHESRRSLDGSGAADATSRERAVPRRRARSRDPLRGRRGLLRSDSHRLSRPRDASGPRELPTARDAEEPSEQPERNNEGEDRQEGRDHRRGVVIDDEEVPIHLQREDVGRPSDAALRIRGPDDDVEELELPEDRHRDDDEGDRPQQGPRNLTKCLPLRRAVHSSRLEVVLRDRREAGRIHDHTEASPGPNGSKDQAQQKGVRGDEPVPGERPDPEPSEEGGNQSDRRFENESEDDADYDQRRDHPEEDERLDH